MSVVFPAPDGPDTMNKVPSEWKLLDILYLLADALDLGLQFYNEAPDRRGTRLRPHRVDLPQHFLRYEIELFPRGLAPVDGLLHLLDVVGQPRQLLGNIAALHHQHDLLRDPLLRHLHASLCGDVLYALLIGCQELAADLVAVSGEVLLE